MEPDPSAGTSRHLQPVRGNHKIATEPDPQVSIDGPFLEEPEQAFMDDLQLQDTQIDLEDLTA
jgi:hypothetical protein